jgi:hypothetical protein
MRLGIPMFRRSWLVIAILMTAVSGCSPSEPAPSKTTGPSATFKNLPSKDDANKADLHATPPKSKVVVVDTLSPLLDTLPKNLWPQDPKNANSLAEAAKWLNTNLHGQRAIVTSSLQAISIIPPSKEGEKYRAVLVNGGPRSQQHFFVIRGFGEGDVQHGLKVWGQPWNVELRKPAAEPSSFGLHLMADKPDINRLRALEMQPGGPETQLNFTIDEITLTPSLITIKLQDFTIDKAP